MAVESIGVTEQVDGVNVACQEATDDDTNKTEIRVIQQMDLVHAKKINLVQLTPDRTVTSPDDVLLTNPIGAPLNEFIITVGDNSLLEVDVRIFSGQADAGCTITPIILTDTNEPLLLLPTKGFSGVHPEFASGAVYFVHSTMPQSLCPPATWYVGQYQKIALFVGVSSPCTAYIWGRCHSGQPNDKYDMFTTNAAGTIGDGTLAWFDSFASSKTKGTG